MTIERESDRAKMAAGYAAAEFVQSGMIVGIGTGTTAAYFIKRLGERCRQGLQISAIATSHVSSQLAVLQGIPMADLEEVTFVDLTVDGADEIDPQKQMIKGGGGALLREKIVASMSREMVVVVDASKQVELLGKALLPVEIVPFAHQATIYKLEQLGYVGTLRRSKEGQIFVTDNHNYIVDLRLAELCEDPEEEDKHIQRIPGVVDTGFFINLAGRVVVGHLSGRVDIF